MCPFRGNSPDILVSVSIVLVFKCGTFLSESAEYLGVRVKRHRGYSWEAVRAGLTWSKAHLYADGRAQGAGCCCHPCATCDSRVPRERQPLKRGACGLGCQARGSLREFKELFCKITLQWKDISCVFFYLKLDSIFFFGWSVMSIFLFFSI